MTTRTLLCALSILLASGCATEKSHTPPPNLTASHFKQTATVTPLDADSHAKLSTEKGYEEPYTGPGDFTARYLIASVDRKTGRAGYALSFMDVTHKPRVQAQVSYESPEGWMETAVKVENGPRKCTDGDCWNLESVSIPLKESLLKTYAQRYQPNAGLSWHFKIAPNLQGEIPLAEIAGLLERVDDYRATLQIER